VTQLKMRGGGESSCSLAETLLFLRESHLSCYFNNELYLTERHSLIKQINCKFIQIQCVLFLCGSQNTSYKLSSRSGTFLVF